MIGVKFTKFIDKTFNNDIFEYLLDIFLQLANITSGDINETLRIMNDLDIKYGLTGNNYGMGNFIDELKEKNFINENPQTLSMELTSKSEQTIRKKSLEEIFKKLKKSGSGNHSTVFNGLGDEISSDSRKFIFGDSIENIDFLSSIKNSQIKSGINSFSLSEEDLEVNEKDNKSNLSTVLMIDISHSMILYGEDRITPAKKVAMALTELITKNYKKDTLDIIAFGNEAIKIEIKDLPYLSVGPFHTNTYDGLQMAMDILRKKKNKNKQIFMITDGKPTCLKEGNGYYTNVFGLDRKIVNKTLDQAAKCKKFGITITTFMIASDPYLQEFVRDFTKINNGKAYFSKLNSLGEFLFEDYVVNRKKKLR